MFDSYLSSGMGWGEGVSHQSSRTEDFSGSFFLIYIYLETSLALLKAASSRKQNPPPKKRLSLVLSL